MRISGKNLLEEVGVTHFGLLVTSDLKVALDADFLALFLEQAPEAGVMNAVADLTIAMRSDVLHAAAFPSQNTERAVRLNSRRMEKLDDLERQLLVSTNTREN